MPGLFELFHNHGKYYLFKPYGGGKPYKIMKTLSFEQMENVQGGRASAGCAAACAGALLFGMGGLIAAAGSGGLGIGFAIAGNYWAWAGAASACS